MKIHLKIIVLVAVLLISMFIIYLKKESPFGLFFWIGINGFVLSIIGFILTAGLTLLNKKRLYKKVISSLPLIVSSILIIIYLSVLWDYRIILPITIYNDLDKEEYKQDLEFFSKTIKTHPGYNDSIALLTEKKLWDLYENQNLDNRDLFVNALSEIVGLFKDGHSTLPTLQVYNKSSFLPLVGYFFEDGFYIISAAEKYKHLENKKLTSINNFKTEEIFKLINIKYGPENEWNARYKVNFYLFSVNTLKSLGVIDEGSNKVLISYKVNKGIIKKTEVSQTPFFNWAFWALKPSKKKLPNSLNIRKPNFLFEIKGETLELTLNLINNISEENTIKKLAADLNQNLKKGNIENLIIDLRNNTGGNNYLYKPIINTIRKYPAINQKQHLFIFTSRTTFSAGINFLDDLVDQTQASIIGEPPGAGTTHYGDAQFVKLPNSGVYFFLSTKLWKGKTHLNTEKLIIPDHQIKYYSQEYFNNEDPWMVTFENLIGSMAKK